MGVTVVLDDSGAVGHGSWVDGTVCSTVGNGQGTVVGAGASWVLRDVTGSGGGSWDGTADPPGPASCVGTSPLVKRGDTWRRCCLVR